MLKTYCNLPFIRLKIDPDGYYQSCCHQTTKYGNILTDNKSIDEIFSSDKIREVKKSVLNNYLHASCKNTSCPHFFSNLDRNKDAEVAKYPIDIELGLPSTWCNIGGLSPTPETACMMCPRSSISYMKTQQGEDNIDKILEFIKPAMPTLKYFSVLGVAEPFYKNKLFEIFDKLEFKKYKDNVHFWTFSNGILFSPDVQDLFLDEYTNESDIGFSIDAANSATYQKIRRANSFDLVVSNIERFFNKTNNMSPRKSWSFTSYNINLLNLEEMEDMVRFSNSVGADKVQFNTTYTAAAGIKMGEHLLLNKNNWERFWEKQQRVEQLAKELNQKVEFYRPFHGGFLSKS